jgi:hypothetical protein
MRKLKTTDVNGSVIGLPVKAGVLEHLQNSYTELIQALLKHVAFLPESSTTIYVLYGCENTGIAPNYIISAGAVYYQGEIYFVDATTFTVSVGAVSVIETTQYQALDGGGNPKGDPILFSDLISRNVLDIRKVKIIDGNNLSPSYIGDFADFKFLPYDQWIQVAYNSGWINGSGPSDSRFLFYRKDPMGYVHLRGQAVYNSGANIVGNLPAGFRPISIQSFAGTNANALTFNLVQVDVNGDILVDSPAASIGYTFWGITFLAEN